MATYVQTVNVGHLATAGVREALTHEVRRGLIARPCSLSPWMFYDAEGSRLFERTQEQVLSICFSHHFHCSPGSTERNIP